jgi:hypothetical protein
LVLIPSCCSCCAIAQARSPSPIWFIQYRGVVLVRTRINVAENEIFRKLSSSHGNSCLCSRIVGELDVTFCGMANAYYEKQ